MRLESGLAAAFARVAIANVARPFPHKLDHVFEGPEPEAADHVARHPVFCGAFDWRSAVHMHWLLVRLLRLFPEGEAAAAIRKTLAGRLTADGMAAERAALARPAAATFERPYGLAWLLELRAELERLRGQEPHAAGCIAAVDPLAGDLAGRLAELMRSAGYPVRAGTHANTAFASLLALDYAHGCRDQELATAVAHAAARWCGRDRDARPDFECPNCGRRHPAESRRPAGAGLLRTGGSQAGEGQDGFARVKSAPHTPRRAARASARLAGPGPAHRLG